MTKPKKKQPLGQTIGGVLFGFEQQVLRTTPPTQELVHRARPDHPLPAGDGGLLTIGMPADEELVLPSATGLDPGPTSGSESPDPAPVPGADEP
jgi:hypothetical protein